MFELNARLTVYLHRDPVDFMGGTGSGLHNCISRVYAPANIGSRLVNGNQNEQVKGWA